MKLNEKILRINPSDFNYLLKYCKRTNRIKGVECKELIYLPYWFVKVELPNMINEGDFEGITKALIWHNTSFWKRLLIIPRYKINAVIPFVCWVREYLERIINMEREYLTSQPDNDLINAGIDTLNELGESNVIDMLAGGNILDWDRVKKLPYHQVFDKLRKNKLEGDIQKRLQKIQAAKAKRK